MLEKCDEMEISGVIPSKIMGETDIYGKLMTPGYRKYLAPITFHVTFVDDWAYSPQGIEIIL